MNDTGQSVCTGFEAGLGLSRRRFLSRFGGGLGSIALADLLGRSSAAGSTAFHPVEGGGVLGAPHRRPTAKRVIYLFQSGGPSQMDLFDDKPVLRERHGEDLPASVRMGQRLTAMSGNQARLPMVGSPFGFHRHGQGGLAFSELLPYTGGVADELCVVKSLHTDAINHGPGVTFMQTGSPFPGRPSMGAWLTYGLGDINEDLPAFVVMVTKDKGGQPLVSRLWGSGFLPSKYQGVRFRAGKDPVLYLDHPDGMTGTNRRHLLDRLRELHQLLLEETGDVEIENRIADYELASRMQSAIPEVADFSKESEAIMNEYGPDVRKPGSFAANCLLARRLAERGVRFIQLYHPGWDHHGGLPKSLPGQCRETDQPAAALVRDLKRRGMLDETLVIFGGEFGRTNYCQGKLTADNFGRDHHPKCFSIWMAGGGIQGGVSFGETDEFCYNVASDPVSVHDLHATLLHCLGIDHERLTFKYQGRWFRLTDVHGKVVKGVLA